MRIGSLFNRMKNFQQQHRTKRSYLPKQLAFFFPLCSSFFLSFLVIFFVVLWKKKKEIYFLCWFSNTKPSDEACALKGCLFFFSLEFGFSLFKYQTKKWCKYPISSRGFEDIIFTRTCFELNGGMLPSGYIS